MNNDSPWGSILGTLFLGGMFFLSRRAGYNDAKKEMCDAIKDLEIERLKEELRIAKSKKMITDFS